MPPHRAFAKGERVEVAPSLGVTLSKGKNSLKHWVNRRGTVADCNRYCVYVIWDGRKTAEQMPIRAFKKLEEV